LGAGVFRNELDQLQRRNKESELIAGTATRAAAQKPLAAGEWPDPIAVLVFVCNRSNAIHNHLEQLLNSTYQYKLLELGNLLRYRPSPEKFPIIVSQDCDDRRVQETVANFGTRVRYIKSEDTGLGRVGQLKIREAEEYGGHILY
uniref:Alpha-1,3-mannosyl-glycoprotein 2-beta-N-acetylglucosaminyltransferase n=1 Tax=Gongylonema pulchrum TaxID=637853 RepID=A0A183DWL5_9BILA